MERLLFEAQTVQNFNFQLSGLGSGVDISVGVLESASGRGGGGGGVWVFTRLGSYAMVGVRVINYSMLPLHFSLVSQSDCIGFGID